MLLSYLSPRTILAMAPDLSRALLDPPMPKMSEVREAEQALHLALLRNRHSYQQEMIAQPLLHIRKSVALFEQVAEM